MDDEIKPKFVKGDIVYFYDYNNRAFEEARITRLNISDTEYNGGKVISYTTTRSEIWLDEDDLYLTSKEALKETINSINNEFNDFLNWEEIFEKNYK